MRLALCCLVLSSTTSVLAQSQPETQPQNRLPDFISPATLHLLRPYGMGCPVGMKAERQASGQQEWVVSPGEALQRSRPNMLANNAGVYIELIEFRSKRMKQAQVEVSYMAPGVHALRVGQDSATPLTVESTKTFTLFAADGEPSMQLAGSLRVGHAGYITRVRLLRVEYTDGTTWQAKTADGCTVEPGLLMAVAGR